MTLSSAHSVPQASGGNPGPYLSYLYLLVIFHDWLKFRKSWCLKRPGFRNSCVRLCLGFKEFRFGKAAMEEEVEEVPNIYTNIDAICFIPLVISSILYVASMDLVHKFSRCETRITLDIHRLEGRIDGLWIPGEWYIDGDNSEWGEGVATGPSYLSFLVLGWFRSSPRTVKIDTCNNQGKRRKNFLSEL